MRLQPTSTQAGSLLTLGYSYCPAGPSVSDCSTNNGNMLWQTINDGTTTRTQGFTYDSVNRLLTATESPTWAQTYVYDKLGNRALLSSSNDPSMGVAQVLRAVTTSSTSVPFDPATNRWTFVGATYDQGQANGPGNLTDVQLDANNSFHAVYDAENRQTATTVVLAGSSPTTTTYVYDGEGQRVVKANGTGTTVYVYDAQGNLAAEYSTAANPDLGTHYLTVDHLGSTRLDTQAVANAPSVFSRSDYLPFGQEIPTTWNRSNYQADPSQRLKFTSKERDAETGLDFFGARYLSSAQGRFTSTDSYEINQEVSKAKSQDQRQTLLHGYITNPQVWNRYAYALNNPLRLVDLNGKCSQPTNLQDNQTGVCIEAFIAAPTIGNGLIKGKGDNRTFTATDPTKSARVRVDVTIDPGSNGAITSTVTTATSETNIGLSRQGYTEMIPIGATLTTDAHGNRQFEVNFTGINGFAGLPGAPPGAIKANLNFTVTPGGQVSLDYGNSTITGFPSFGVYSYGTGANGQPQVKSLVEAKEKDQSYLTKAPIAVPKP